MADSFETVHQRMLEKLPDNGAWFGRTKAPMVRALMRIPATEIKALSDLIDYSKNAVFLLKARGDAPDLWGRDIDIERFSGEDDVTYTQRMQAEILRERNTIPSIEKGTVDILQHESTVYEPWRDVLRFGQHSKLGKNKLSGRYYTNAVIDVCLIGHHLAIVDTITRLRACGVRAFFTFIFDAPVVSGVNYIISDETEIRDVAIVERHDTFKAAELYDDTGFVTNVTDPNSPPFTTDGILGYDRTP